MKSGVSNARVRPARAPGTPVAGAVDKFPSPAFEKPARPRFLHTQDPPEAKKTALADGSIPALRGPDQVSRRLRRLGPRGCLLAFDVGQPAFPFLNFVILSAHNKNLYTTDALGLCMTMMIRSARFNTYLAALLLVLVAPSVAQVRSTSSTNSQH